MKYKLMHPYPEILFCLIHDLHLQYRQLSIPTSTFNSDGIAISMKEFYGEITAQPVYQTYCFFLFV